MASNTIGYIRYVVKRNVFKHSFFEAYSFRTHTFPHHLSVKVWAWIAKMVVWCSEIEGSAAEHSVFTTSKARDKNEICWCLLHILLKHARPMPLLLAQYVQDNAIMRTNCNCLTPECTVITPECKWNGLIYIIIYIYYIYIYYNYFYRMAIPLPKEGMNSTDFEHPFMWKCQGGCMTVLRWRAKKKQVFKRTQDDPVTVFFPVLKVNHWFARSPTPTAPTLLARPPRCAAPALCDTAAPSWLVLKLLAMRGCANTSCKFQVKAWLLVVEVEKNFPDWLDFAWFWSLNHLYLVNFQVCMTLWSWYSSRLNEAQFS